MILDSVLTVTAAAPELTLLSLDELKAAVSISDGSQDTALKRLNLRLAARITAACKVPGDGENPPTLRRETLTETIRLRLRPASSADYYLRPEELWLGRRPIASVISVTENSVALDPAAPDYEILPASGRLRRLSNDEPARWASGKIVVSYVAGWDTVPDDLKFAAERLAKLYWTEQSRDPGLKAEDVPGVLSQQFWIGAPSDPDIPGDVLEALGPYRNMLIG